MEQKNKKVKRNFIPQSIGDTLRKVNMRFSSKYGKIEFIIHSKWSEIAGSYFSEHSEPKSVSRIPDYHDESGEMIYKNHLNVSVTPAAAIEFQHFKDTILEKINSYFGYKAILDLRIQQNYIPKDYKKLDKMNNRELTTIENEKISNEIKDINSKNLQDSLFNLGKNITKERK